MNSYLLKKPVKPIEPMPKAKISDVLKAMGDTAFQARNLSRALEIWKDMLEDKATILFGLAGAMIPAGMRRLMAYLITNRMIDCVVSTGANLFHDIHETIGRRHWQGDACMDDIALREEGIDRIYDVLAPEHEFIATDRYIVEFVSKLDLARAYTTREFLYLLGKHLTDELGGERIKGSDGILTSAYKAGIPVYCPAIGDSAIAIALADAKLNLLFDTVSDVRETAEIVIDAKTTGVVYVGGGSPKNFIQQTEVTATLINKKGSLGHRYAIQIITDPPHWGGLSGCTFEEAQSWGKIAKEARKVTVYSDATIALPLLVSALADEREGKKRNAPRLRVME